MEVFYDAVAGVDVHQEQLTITTLVGNDSRNLKKTTWECAVEKHDIYKM
jgi:hypothetical protein